METLWFIIISVLLTVYVVLDGFDFGAGIVYLFIAKNDIERRTVLNAIGPVWDGNEVWLIAAGGTLFFAFPVVFSSGFSGFYLALIMMLWLLMIRGLAMELRSHIKNTLWRSFWDAGLAFSSSVMALVLGAALGNLIRGVPLNADGYFFVPFWTDFKIGSNPGILDWYTITVGLLAFFLLAVHGANYIAMKTGGELQLRARSISKKFIWIVVVLSVVVPVLTYSVRHDMFRNFNANPVGYLIPVVSLSSLIAMVYFRYRNSDTLAFISSSLFIAASLFTAVFTMYPNLLISTTDSSFSLTVFNSAASSYGLSVGLIWFTIGITLAISYTVFMYRSFKGKVIVSEEDEGY